MAEELKPLVTRQKWKSCCGSASFAFHLTKPIRKTQIHFFKEAGYSVPQNFFDAGIFYVQIEHLVATASFGSTRISIRCNGSKCAEHLDAFQAVLEKAISS